MAGSPPGAALATRSGDVRSAHMARIAKSAAPGGLAAIFKVVLAVVFEAARPLVAWL